MISLGWSTEDNTRKLGWELSGNKTMPEPSASYSVGNSLDLRQEILKQKSEGRKDWNIHPKNRWCYEYYKYEWQDFTLALEEAAIRGMSGVMTFTMATLSNPFRQGLARGEHEKSQIVPQKSTKKAKVEKHTKQGKERAKKDKARCPAAVMIGCRQAIGRKWRR